MDFGESELQEIVSALKLTQRKVNLLCNWIRMKFGDDPTLPQSLFHERNECDSVKAEIEENELNQNHEPLEESNGSSYLKETRDFVENSKKNFKCSKCKMAFCSSRALKLHEYTHCFVKVTRMQPNQESKSQPIAADGASKPRKERLVTRSTDPDFSFISWDDNDSDVMQISSVGGEGLNVAEHLQLEKPTCFQDEDEATTSKKLKMISSKTQESNKKSSEDNTKSNQFYSCKYCEKTFLNARKLNYHRKKFHQKELKSSGYPCSECEKVFLTPGTRRFHRQTAHPYCFINEYDDPDSKGTMHCPICEKVFSKPGLAKHLRIKHNGETTQEMLEQHKLQLCKSCNKVFTNSSYFKAHLIKFHPEEYELKMKEISSQNPKPSDEQGEVKAIRCPLCPTTDKKIFTKYRLAEHLRSAHKEEVTEEMIQIYKLPYIESKHLCQVCEKTLTSFASLKVHLKMFHLEVYEAKVKAGEFIQKKNPIPLDTENRSQNVECENRHTDHSSNPGFLCSVCGFSTTRKEYLDRHMGQHSSDRKFKCTKCTSTFKYRQGFQNHMRRMRLNPNLPNLQCYLCGEFFKNVSTLQEHIRCVHENLRAHRCHLCEKEFKKGSHLKYHLRTHQNPNSRKRGLNKDREPRRRGSSNKSTIQNTGNNENSDSVALNPYQYQQQW